MTDDPIQGMAQRFPHVLIPVLAASKFGPMSLGLLVAYEQAHDQEPVAPIMEKALLHSASALRRNAGETGGWLVSNAREKAEAAMDSALKGADGLDEEQRASFVKLASLYCTSFSLLTLISGERHGKAGPADIARYKNLLIETLSDDTRGAMDRHGAENAANDYVKTLRRLAQQPDIDLSRAPSTRVHLSGRDHADEALKENVRQACRQQLRTLDIGGIGAEYKSVERFFARGAMSEPQAEAYMNRVASHAEDIGLCEVADDSASRYAATKKFMAELNQRLSKLIASEFKCSAELAARIVDVSYLHKAAFDMADSYASERGGVASMGGFRARPELRLKLTDALTDVADQDQHVPAPILKHTVAEFEASLRAAANGRAYVPLPPPQ